MRASRVFVGVALLALLAPVEAQDETGVDSLIERLEHPLWTARRDAAEAIGNRGPRARAAA